MGEQIVIIGGGFGGLYAAKRLKHAPVDVTLIDRRNHHLFQPLLYQTATGALSPADIATPLRRLLKDQRNVRVLLGEVVDFDVANKQVILRDGAVGYDKLVVAAGSGKNYFGNDQWMANAPGLKTVEDATEIRRRILTAFEAAERTTDPGKVRTWLTFVVIGGGPTGVEMAGALAEIAHETLQNEFRNINPSDARIVLVQSGERILPTYAPELSARATAALERLGVEVLTGLRVTDVGDRGVTVSSRAGETYLPSRTVLWTAGVQASPLGQALAAATSAEVDRGGRVIVEPDLSVPGHPDIFVIGDLAHFAHQTGEPLPGVAQVAIQQGRYVAQLIARRRAGKRVSPFFYRDRGNMATIGRGKAVAEIGRLRLSGWLAWQIWAVVHLMYQMDVENRMLVFIQWIWNYLTRKRSALLITDRDQKATNPQAQASLNLITNSGVFLRVSDVREKKSS
ncbi:MAG: NAD(P)/FAD-dependent oxidoreductase [Anaerolineae bacterium]|nr:NAD(P)/FAD-dependent oxidoreductase [Anaerolineae bacterium]